MADEDEVEVLRSATVQGKLLWELVVARVAAGNTGGVRRALAWAAWHLLDVSGPEPVVVGRKPEKRTRDSEDQAPEPGQIVIENPNDELVRVRWQRPKHR